MDFFCLNISILSRLLLSMVAIAGRFFKSKIAYQKSALPIALKVCLVFGWVLKVNLVINFVIFLTLKGNPYTRVPGWDPGI